MLRSAAPGITIAAVEREIETRKHRLAFPPPIEAVFEEEGRVQRLRMLITTGIVAVVLYDVFLIADWLTLRDMFPFMVAARLGIFTPTIVGMVLYARWLVGRGTPGWVFETLATTAGVLGVMLPMTALVFSESPFRLNYQYGSLLVMMFTTVVHRLRFSFALFGLAAMFGIQIATTYLARAFDPETFTGIVMFFATACILLAITTYVLERAERRSFLFALRGTLLRRQIEAGARTDALTGLSNRHHLAEVTDTVWAEAEPRVVSAILLDIDHFKAFNDSRGHLAGDACLRTVGARVAEVAGAWDGIAFRFGGEEILILMPGVAPDAAARAAEAVRAAIDAAAIPHPVLGVGRTVTASLGVASGVAPATGVEELIAAADTALYAAKNAGRNRVYPSEAPARYEGREPHLAAA